MKQVEIAEIEALWLSHIEVWGTHFTSVFLVFLVFSVMAGWIVEILFMLFFALLLCNGQNIAEYEVYWLMGVPAINS